MATSSRSLAVQIALILSVCANVVLGVGLFMQFRYNDDVERRLKEADNKASEAVAGLRTRDTEVQSLKTLIGHDYSEIGVDDASNPNTVMGAGHEDLRKYGKQLQDSNYTLTLSKLRQELDNYTAQFGQLQSTVTQHQQTIAGLEGTYQERVVEQQNRAQAAEQTRDEAQVSKTEAVAGLESAVNQLRADLAARQAEIDSAQAAHDEAIKQWEINYSQLQSINTQLQERIDNESQVQFEVPDGLITSVDPVTNMVYINIGELDLLRVGTTFSVYEKDLHAMSRDAKDIKGAIEVTRIIDNHLAEARIVDTELSKPIAPGDPIYTPLWTPGQKLLFSIVGFIDLDGDGESDRDLLHEIVRGVNGEVDNEVLDDGETIGNGITVNTKFLVVGELPKIDETTKESESQIFTKILDEHKRLVDEATRQGVQTINLGNFLSFAGYRPSRRVWRPGEDMPWTLKRGTRNAPVSPGQTSAVYSGNKRRTVPTSPGTTSQIFGGKQ